jgi:hypothetical protein
MKQIKNFMCIHHISLAAFLIVVKKLMALIARLYKRKIVILLNNSDLNLKLYAKGRHVK